ncbi:membrane protein insertion efficiency factor YidD [Candidatus Poriferisodalis sp.]|uniref:membrane protein insertion efficiency factor YidD n=1 Tax=Candidatus Poriferisodalis sp. TaxID=3101277 RepID=UPI003AF713D5
MKTGPVARALIAVVRFYRALPRSRQPSCRFDPTCSQFALDAVRAWGAVRGGWLATRRVCRCHPWGGWGYDPVPGRSGQDRRADAATGSWEH